MTKWLEWASTILACIGLSLVATSCAAHRQPPCVSYCGMLLDEKGNGSMSCDVIDEAEKKMLDEIDKEFCKSDSRACKKNMCEKIFGWQLHGTDDVVFGVDGRLAVGLSNCQTKEMWLGANQDWRHGSYPHELFHVIQECRTGWTDEGEREEGGYGHEGWTSRGYYDFIKDFREGRR